MYLCGRGVSFVPEESGPIRLAYSSGYDCTTTMHLLNIFAPLLLLLLLLPACSDDAAETPEESTELNEVSSTTLTNLHPVLDSRVRTGDSMLVDLDGLIREGVIAEGDMELIGFYVRSLGGLNDPDGSLARKSYRQLIREALVSDLSDPQEEPCAGCSDSLIIYFPDNNGMVYFGMGEKSLQEMIGEALAVGSTLPEYRKPPYSRQIDSAEWSGMMNRLYSERKDPYDPVLFGNTLIVLSRNGEKPGDYTYGQILTVVERVKEMPEFDRLRDDLRELTDGVDEE